MRVNKQTLMHSVAHHVTLTHLCLFPIHLLSRSFSCHASTIARPRKHTTRRFIQTAVERGKSEGELEGKSEEESVATVASAEW